MATFGIKRNIYVELLVGRRWKCNEWRQSVVYAQFVFEEWKHIQSRWASRNDQPVARNALISGLLTYCRFLFALLIIWTAIPVNLWHNCEHEDTSTSAVGTTELHETCHVCDFEFPPAIQHSGTQIPQSTSFTFPKRELACIHAVALPPALCLNKAPPVV